MTWAPTGLFPGVGKLGVWDRKSPSGVQGWSPGEGLRAKLPEETTGCENNAYIIRLYTGRFAVTTNA